jgi:uncharacterized membrane protein YhaH (DUF805 family)
MKLNLPTNTNVLLGIFVIYIFLLIICLISLLKRNIEPIQKIMWLIILIFIPVIGIVLYFSFSFPKKEVNFEK